MYSIPDTSVAPSQENYQYYNLQGLPYTGEMRQQMTAAEYQARMLVTARVGYGNYDTALPLDQHFGRTLQEVLVKSQTGEYRILGHREQWVTCEKYGVRILQFIQWVEYSNRVGSELPEAVTKKARPPMLDFLSGDGR